MKRIFIMLLIACSAITTISADPLANPQKKPETVIFTLNAIIQKFGLSEGQVYSVNRNPNTGIIESSTKIVPFRCSANSMQNDNVLKAVALNFPKEEPLAYQFLHIQPGSTENFQLKVITDNGKSNGTQRIRTNKNQEMWLMCCKNPENPTLRDAYAVTWEYMHDQKNQVLGTVYMITSLRPDLFEKSMSTDLYAKDQDGSKMRFTLEGRVGDDLKDSLYVFYIAETAEQLNNAPDDSYTFTMPVINGRFGVSVENDKPFVGRIRTVMPDGSLCQLWTNIDCVPGETYHITTHNGWYEEDRDYERRVGRYSGKSLLNARQIAGNDDVDMLEVDTIPVVDDVPVDYVNDEGTNRRAIQWRENLTPKQKVQFAAKAQTFDTYEKVLKQSYDLIGKEINGMRDPQIINGVFDRIYKQNKTFDNHIQDFVKFGLNTGLPKESLPDFYKVVLDSYSKQNQAIARFYKEYGAYTKSARKVQKQVNKLTEKYMAEMMKVIK